MTTLTDAPVITEPTALFDLDEDVYHADRLLPERSLSSTMVKTILQPAGPARLREVMLNGQPSKKEWDFGTAAHEKILGRGQPVIAIDGNRNRTDVKRAITEAEAEGYLVLKTPEVEAVDAMAEAILANPLAGELLTAGQGQPEVSMFGIDDQTGRWLRGRLDFLHSPELIVDYKTTKSVDDRPFTNDAYSHGYWTQAEHYRALAVELELVNPDADYLLIAQEKTAPYLVRVFRFDDISRELAAARLRTAYDLWDRALTLDDWPGFPPTVTTLTPPRWALNEGDEEE